MHAACFELEHSSVHLQASTSTSVAGPVAGTAGDSTLKIFINVTYTAASIQLPFSNPTAVQTGTVSLTANNSPLAGSSSVASSGSGFVTFAFTPSTPLQSGSEPLYSVHRARTAPSPSSFKMLTSSPARIPDCIPGSRACVRREWLRSWHLIVLLRCSLLCRCHVWEPRALHSGLVQSGSFDPGHHASGEPLTVPQPTDHTSSF